MLRATLVAAAVGVWEEGHLSVPLDEGKLA